MGPLDIARLCPSPGTLTDAAGEVVAGRCHRTGGPLARAVGLLGTRDLSEGLALWIEPCAAVHTLGMRAPVSCLFLAPGGRVLRAVPALGPGRAAWCPGARAVVEAAPATLAAVGAGAHLRWVPATDSSATSDIRCR